MSGLEVVAAVAGIVGAYTSAASTYYAWRAKKAARIANSQNQFLEMSLKTGGETVQKEYDIYFARVGGKFAAGDDRGRAEMLAYVVKLQHIVITLMAESSASSLIVLPKLPTILTTSDDTRRGVATALAEQYQRMEQSRPISMGLPSVPATSGNTYYIPPVVAVDRRSFNRRRLDAVLGRDPTRARRFLP